MNKGLITRIGEWMDRKWAAKATWLDVQEQESKCSDSHIGLLAVTAELEKTTTSISQTNVMLEQIVDANQKGLAILEKKFTADIFGLRKAITDLTVVTQAPSEVAKEFAELKARFEKLELYLGMSRKVDPTKPAVAKSAFTM